MRMVTNACVVGAIALAVTASAACNRPPAEQDAARTTAAPPAKSQPNDAAITTSVQARFYADDSIRARNIDVATNKAVVTLRGSVDSEAAKQQAVNLAQSVEGVTRVDDRMRVAQPGAPGTIAEGPQPPRPEEGRATGTAGRDAEGRVLPGWVTTKIQAQYFVNPEIKPWNIDVTTTSDGVVTLRGEVDSTQDKAEAVRIAQGTDGVSRVDDRLRVKGAAEGVATRPADEDAGIGRPDAWLTAKVQAKYFLDDDVKARDIDVDTQDGVVTLKGTVESESERRHALALARNTDGVKSVTDQLQIRPETAREPDTARPMRPVDQIDNDPWITTKIQSKYFLDPDVKGRQIDVDTKSGVVTLKGTVDNEEQKQEAERIARDTDGVKKVLNQITVGQR